jgi:hypothetical protein
MLYYIEFLEFPKLMWVCFWLLHASQIQPCVKVVYMVSWIDYNRDNAWETSKNPSCFNCEQNKQGLESWLVKHDYLIPILYPCFDRLRISVVHFCLYGAWRYMLMFTQIKCYFFNIKKCAWIFIPIKFNFPFTISRNLVFPFWIILLVLF